MANTSTINLTSLDIPTQMADFRAFMQSQDAFKDYNFEGSNLSALLRVMAYNSFKNGFFLNMVMSEGFIDTAQTRPAVLSHAKELNYLPRSARSASANISFTFNGTQPAYVLPKGTTFTAIVKNSGLNFSLEDTLLVTSTNNLFTVSTTVYEGTYFADSYVVDYSQTNQRFLLSNQNVDTNSLTVMVYQDGQVTGTLYSLKSSLLDLDETSKVFFLQATGNNQYEVIFGDGVSGYRPPNGATTVFDYRISKGTGGNGAQTFNLNTSIGDGVSNISGIYTDAESGGGLDPEDTESIRFYAPRHFQIQERATGADDYSNLLKMNFPEIRTASAIGGEDLDPPQYGKVVIAVDITDVDGIPDSKRQQYTNFIQPRCSIGVKPVFVIPAYTFIDISSNITYNLNTTTLTPNSISVMTLAQIATFANNNIDDFGSTLRYSKLTAAIDAAHPSIIGNETTVDVYKKLTPVMGTDNTITVSFGMALEQGTPVSNTVFPTREERCLISDNYISYSGSVFLTDDGNGNIWTAVNRGSSTQLLTNVGTVSYDTGTIVLSKWNVQNYSGDGIKLFASTAEQDITAPQDTILQLEIGQVSLSITEGRE